MQAAGTGSERSHLQESQWAFEVGEDADECLTGLKFGTPLQKLDLRQPGQEPPMHRELNNFCGRWPSRGISTNHDRNYFDQSAVSISARFHVFISANPDHRIQASRPRIRTDRGSRQRRPFVQPMDASSLVAAHA